MRNIIFIAIISILFSSCEIVQPFEIKPLSYNVLSTDTLPDYTQNLYDEWVSTRGFVLKTGAVDIQSWTGRVNSTVLAPDVSFQKPIAGEITIANNKGLQLPSNSPVTGNVSIAFVIKASARQNKEQRLFHAVNTPTIILQAEKSAANQNMGMVYGSQSLDFGVPFPYDGQYHVVVFKINSGVNASIYIDGAKVGNTVTFSSSTAIDWTTNNTRRFFRTGATGTVPFVGGAKKIRIYKEALSDSVISIIGNHANAFFTDVVDDTPVVRIGLLGQSQIQGVSANYNDLPDSLKGAIPGVIIWDFNVRKWIPFNSASLPSGLGVGPVVSLAYLFHQAHPDKIVAINCYAKGGTSLAVDWKTDGTGAIYNNFITYFNESTAILDIEMRNNRQMKSVLWGQGETDTQNLIWANAYQGSEVIFKDDLRNDTGWLYIAEFNIHAGLPGHTYPYDDTIRTAKIFNAENDLNSFLLSTDDVTRFPVDGGHVHYTAIGYVHIGQDVFDFMNQ